MRSSSCLAFLVILYAFFFPATVSAQTQQKISQFETAGLCDLLIDKSGVYHAVFQEVPGSGKPKFIYHSSSTNKGATWSKPITVSNDQTGNGAGYPRILQDGSGRIYAIWKRFGNTKENYPVTDPLLEGPGGYAMGTIFYKVLSSGTWSQQQQINETEETQHSWFATVTPQGQVAVLWTQLGPDAIKHKFTGQPYCDYVRMATLTGTSHSAIADLSVPAKAQGEAPSATLEQKGGSNLQGYIDNAGIPHLLYEVYEDDMRQLKYFDGKTKRSIYKYPKYGTFNTFGYPAKLLVDEKGVDHAILLPDQAALENLQLWNINLTTNQNTPVLNMEANGKTIYDFQASQGPRGSMAVTIDVGAVAGGNTEALGAFYENGKWTKMMLTNNASKEKFFYKEFPSVAYVGRTYVSQLTKYNSKFSSVAWDPAGKKSLIMTLSAFSTTGGYATASPSVVFLPIDR